MNVTTKVQLLEAMDIFTLKYEKCRSKTCCPESGDIQIILFLYSELTLIMHAASETTELTGLSKPKN